jgi:hypothetical protein
MFNPSYFSPKVSVSNNQTGDPDNRLPSVIAKKNRYRLFRAGNGFSVCLLLI